jgi:high-affinity iron transporter
MGASFLITLREGLEISLVLAIMLAYLAKTGRSNLFRPVAIGSAAAVGLCIVAGIIFHVVVGEFTGKPEQAIEGSIAIVAAAVLTWMIFWMRKHARSMAGTLHQSLDTAAGKSAMAVGFVGFAAVAREGFETVLFLLGAETGTSSGAAVVVGGLIGLAVSSVLGVLVYRSGSRINLRKFFTVTGGLLIVFAAGLFAKAVHEFRELFGVEGALAKPLWNITSGPLAKGTFHDFIAGLFGWAPDPERIRVAAYVLYLVPVAIAFFGGISRFRKTPASAASSLPSRETALV